MGRWPDLFRQRGAVAVGEGHRGHGGLACTSNLAGYLLVCSLLLGGPQVV